MKMNKREKQIAIKSALTSKVQDSKLIVVDEFKLDEIKTSKFAQILDNLKAPKALACNKWIRMRRLFFQLETSQSS
mgnify:CR=1 FL=1